MSDVILVCMPFGPVFSASIGLSLLKAVAEQHGIAVRIRYFSIDFAERIGQALYCRLMGECELAVDAMAGEWIFASGLFASSEQAVRRYVDEVLRKKGAPDLEGVSEAVIRRILEVRGKVDAFLDDCVAEVCRESPRLVGFTSMFQQHTASLALARRIKQARPDIAVVLGGANCVGSMGAETVRQFPFVDAVVSGDGEIVFPELVRRILAAQPLRGLPGVLTPPRPGQEDTSIEPDHAPTVEDLDALPYPDYSDYFRQFGESRYARSWQPSLFFETSRGCWWGERTHCTFCGLNGRAIAFRSKSAPRALAEIVRLTESHPGCDVEVTDNILDLGYFDSFLPQLARRRLGVDFYWETKANLRKEQVRILRDAGVRTVQPGIESFSDPVLRLMRKGVSGLQNIQLLKWCREFGLHATWNLLWGFPGEPAEEYTRMARLVPLLTHLAPPLSWGTIRLDRFSPNFADAEARGFVNVAPIAPYSHVYPLPDAALRNLACYFTFDYREKRDVDAYVAALERELERWTRESCRSDLFSAEVDGALVLWDLRPVAREPLTVLEGADACLHRASDKASSVRELVQGMCGQPPSAQILEDVEARLDRLVDRRLVWKDGRRYLALAVPVGDNAPKPQVMALFLETLRHIGKRADGGFLVPVNGGGPAATMRRVRRTRSRTCASRSNKPAVSASSFSFSPAGELFVKVGHG